jgi:hypothetical protein
MTQYDAIKWHKCVFCKYETKRNYDLKRHQNAKHKFELSPENIIIKNEEKVNPNEEKVNPNEEKVNPKEGKVNLCEDNIHICKKCNKIYKTNKHLLIHEKTCKGVDELTCPRCMVSFTKKQAKSRHIKADKCKARSIIHARTPNVQNITGHNNVTTIQNAETIQNINNNIIINNFGSERLDHISDDDMKKILQSGINTVPLYIEKKHFDNNFPENQNIKYTNDNKCQVLEDNSWKEKDIGLLSTNLMKDNTEVLLMYYDNNEVKLLNEIKDSEKFDHIRNKLIVIYNKSDNQKYNEVLSKIKDLIKNS